jgi:hypothetical protein
MFIRINNKGGKKYAMLVDAYRDKNGKVKHKIIKYLGRVEKKPKLEDVLKELNRIKKLSKN